MKNLYPEDHAEQRFSKELSQLRRDARAGLVVVAVVASGALVSLLLVTWAAVHFISKVW